MSDNLIAETKSKLDDLEQRIHAAKSAIGGLGDDAELAWKDMVDRHNDLRRKLDSPGHHPSSVAEGLRYDIDILNTSFEKWIAKVEGKFTK